MAVVVSERRPVPLFQHVLVGPTLYDLFADVAPDRPGVRRPAATRSTPPWSGSPGTSPATSATTPGGRAGKGGGGRRTVGYGSGAYGGAAHRSRTDGAGHRPRSLHSPGRPEIVELLDRAALLPAIMFIFSRAGCDGAVRQTARLGAAADQPGRAAGDRRDHRAAHRRTVRRRPPGAGLRPVRRGDDPRDRRPPRRDAARLQGVRRGGLRPRPDQGGLRHRDAGAGHQHAGPVGGAGEAGQVQRRDPRRHHPGGVHPADRPGRAARHRRRGPRRGASGSRGWTRARSPGSPRGGPTRCGPPSRRPTTWRSTWSAASAGIGPGPCWSSRSPSSSPTARWSGWPARWPATRTAIEAGWAEAACDRGDFAAYARLRAEIAARRGARGPGTPHRPAGRVAADPVDPEAGRHHPGAERPQPGLGGGHRPGHPQR